MNDLLINIDDALNSKIATFSFFDFQFTTRAFLRPHRLYFVWLRFAVEQFLKHEITIPLYGESFDYFTPTCLLYERKTGLNRGTTCPNKSVPDIGLRLFDKNRFQLKSSESKGGLYACGRN